MSSILPEAAAEFLENYQRDVPFRWSSGDLAAQREFVNAQVADRDWLDWSTPLAALPLFQAGNTQTAPGTLQQYDALVLAGPVVELVEPAALLRRATAPLRPGGRLVSIIPCLRDNSPESQQFMQHAAAMLWPYHTAEELLEMLREPGWQIESPARGFVPIRQFNQAVLKDQLGFKGFNRIFARLAAEGYDPAEVGWGELRLVAALNL